MNKHIIYIALLGLVVSGCTHQIKTGTTLENQNTNQVPIVPDVIVQDTSIIKLRSPQKDQVLKSPFLVGGEARVPGNVVYVRVRNQNGDVVISEQARVQGELGELGPFGVLLTFQFQATDQGFVEVYSIDPNTNKEIEFSTVEVNFDTSSSRSLPTPAG
jgi:hypothetical protein